MDAQVPAKFNILDGLIVVLLAAAVAYAGWKIFRPEKSLGEITTIEVEVKARQNLVSMFQAGDDLYNVLYKRGRLPFGKIDAVLAVKPLAEANVGMDGRMVVSDNPLFNAVTLRIRFLRPMLVYPDKIVYPQSPFRPDLRVGQDFRIMNFKVNLTGLILAQGFKPKP